MQRAVDAQPARRHAQGASSEREGHRKLQGSLSQLGRATGYLKGEGEGSRWARFPKISAEDSRTDDETLVSFPQSCLSEEDDPELIIHVPFTCDVKLKSISVIGGSEGTSPSLRVSALKP